MFHMTEEGQKEIKNSDYDAEKLTILEGLKAVRKRPSMYIGSTGPNGLHHLVYEVVDNSIDEAMAGFCNEITIIMHDDGSVSVQDNGRGIPTDIHAKHGLSGVEIVMTKLHAGGKFDDSTYKVSGGLHGVGVSVVNALSLCLEVKVYRNGNIYYQKFERGDKATGLDIIGKSTKNGTYVRFYPDPEIFDEIVFDYTTLVKRVKELAFLNKGLSISISQESTGEGEKFHYEGGIKAYVEYLNNNKVALHDNVVYIEDTEEDNQVEVALQYSDSYISNVYSFANNIHTREGGYHLSGFKAGLTRTINAYAREKNILKDSDPNFQGNDILEGLTAIISVRLSDPQFEGQTKTKLGNRDLQGIVQKVTQQNLSEFLEENPQTGDLILKKAIMAASARIAAKKARDLTRRKSLLESSSLPGKLADCQSKDPKECEVFIVEGDSAGGSAKQGRDRYFQAILPLRGKILNVEKARLDRILRNEEILAMLTALGCGIGEEFDIEKLRYHKIIIMTDADVDGAHIRTLLLTFFYRYLKPLVDKGHVYIANPPLYSIKKGKEIHYAYTEKEKDNIVQEMGERGLKLQRYKGLGEMNPGQLWDTTMDKDNRILIRIDDPDAIESDKLFSMLMGELVEPRKKFITDHALEAEYIDV